MTKLRRLYSNPTLEFYTPDYSTTLELPFIDGIPGPVFPGLADNFVGVKIDIVNELIKNKEATIYAKVKDNSMKNMGVYNGDLLIIDRSLEPENDKTALCYIDGKFTAKRVKIEQNVIWLITENDDFEPIKVTQDNEFIIWGILIASIKKI
ncbi:translesion error-prone DNA polymerase V autoproteolytic subunit [Flavobacterium sp.]|uniref:LexA family protein n=1 Tax=Flavobacterium sp. TaxID=239 RepID=UPI0025CCC400|nr:translesion error-prone DNA polymerase V autoproteolytic subunit [Flavobacterium sp.]